MDRGSFTVYSLEFLNVKDGHEGSENVFWLKAFRKYISVPF